MILFWWLEKRQAQFPFKKWRIDSSGCSPFERLLYWLYYHFWVCLHCTLLPWQSLYSLSFYESLQTLVWDSYIFLFSACSKFTQLKVSIYASHDHKLRAHKKDMKQRYLVCKITFLCQALSYIKWSIKVCSILTDTMHTGPMQYNANWPQDVLRFHCATAMTMNLTPLMGDGRTYTDFLSCEI